MKKFYILLLLVILSLTLVGCKEKTNIDDEPKDKNKEQEVIENIDILHGDKPYVFMSPEKGNTNIIYGTKSLVDKVNSITGSKFKAYRDNYPQSDDHYEILVGLTNRQESIDAYNELADNSYMIKSVGHNIVIIGKNDICTSFALLMFENDILGDETKCGNDKLVLNSFKTTVTRSADVSLAEIITLGLTPSAELEQVLRIEPLDDKYFITQSGCSDGTYFYIDINPRENSKNIIQKYDMNYNLIRQSEVIPLGHCNGMCYNPKTNEIVCSHCEDKSIIVIVDAETLTVKKNVTLTEGGATSICYNENLDQYACGSGRNELYIYDSEFNLIKSLETKERKEYADKGYTVQDCETDGEFIYFEMPLTGTENVLVVYDWDGVYKTTIKLNQTMEGESFIYTNGEYYVLFYKSMDGAVMYKMKYSFKYE